MFATTTRWTIPGAIAAAMSVAGCAQDHQGLALLRPKASNAPANRANDVSNVVCFFPANMWQSFDVEGDTKPEGFAFVLYLVSGKTGKGSYVDGQLKVSMYKFDRAPDGSKVRSLAQDWSVDTRDLPKRKATRLGVGYQPYMYWGDTKVLGKEIEIMVQYRSPSGQRVVGQTVHLKVPGDSEQLT